MKRRPPNSEAFLQRLRQKFDAGGLRSALGALAERFQPEVPDGSGRILHLSDTPSCMYAYLSRLLKRVNPSVIVHTGDLADDIKLELYPGERERYRAAARRLMDILAAPHRQVVLVLGNHDERELLPPLPPDCSVREGSEALTLRGVAFRACHSAEELFERPARYNLFGHSAEPVSYEDSEGRCFLNGMEWMRLIDPRSGEIWHLQYPKGTNDARLLRGLRHH